MDIYDDSMWLINLVENLLAVTRIEEGRLNLRITEDLMDDDDPQKRYIILTERVKNIIFPLKAKKNFFLQNGSKLIVQVIINIVDNAIKYTPKTLILLFGQKSGKTSNRIYIG